MKSILDRTFRYTASYDTDLRRTFARVRRDHRKLAPKAILKTPAGLASVSPIGMNKVADR